MSSTKTTNLQLNTWAASDDVLMDEFNQNFTKIDDKFSGTTGHLHTGVAGDATKISAANVTFSDAKFTSTNLKAALDELFTGANSKKNSIATAIGYSPITGDTMTTNINKLKEGKENLILAVNERGQDLPMTASLVDIAGRIAQANWPEASFGDALPENVAGGETFKNNDSASIILTGSVPNRGTVVYDATTSDITIPPGFYAPGSVVKGYAELQTWAIVRGHNIFGIEGAYDPAPGYRVGDNVLPWKMVKNRVYDASPEWTQYITPLNNDMSLYWLAGSLVVVYNDTDSKGHIVKYSKTGISTWSYETATPIFKSWKQSTTDLFIIIDGSHILGFNISTNTKFVDALGGEPNEQMIVTSNRIVIPVLGHAYTKDFTGKYIIDFWSSATEFNDVDYYKPNNQPYVNTVHYGAYGTVDKLNPDYMVTGEVYRSSTLSGFIIDESGYIHAWDTYSNTMTKIDPNQPYGQVLASYHLPAVSSGWYAQGDGFYTVCYLTNPNRFAVLRCDSNWVPDWRIEFKEYGAGTPYSSICVVDDEGSIYMFNGGLKKYRTTIDGYQILSL